MTPSTPARLTALLLLACSGRQAPLVTEQVEPATPAADAAKAAPARCADKASLGAHFGQACAVVGTYRVEAIPLKGGQSLAWSVVTLADGSRVMLESLWDVSKMPAPATVARLQGRKVEAVGLLHTAPPKESPENFGFPCVSPVQSLRVLDD